MNTYESWLYRNFNIPTHEADMNGLIVAFDPSGKNAILNQQVYSMKESYEFDSRVVAKSDTYVNLLSEAEWAFNEGYEHIIMLTEEMQVAEVEKFLKERCSNAFESIQVMAEHGYRIREAEPAQQIDPNQQPQTDPNQQAQAQPQAAAQPQVQQATKTYILLSGNPPMNGFATLLSNVEKYFVQEAANQPEIALHNMGQKYSFDMNLRMQWIFGNSQVPGVHILYGPSGVMKYQGYKNPAIVQQAPKAIPDATAFLTEIKNMQSPIKLLVPGNMKSLLMKTFQGPNITIEEMKGTKDTEAQKQSQFLALGNKIAQDSITAMEKKVEEQTAKLKGEPEENPEVEEPTDNKPDTVQEGYFLRVSQMREAEAPTATEKSDAEMQEEEMTQADEITVSFIMMCRMATEGKAVTMESMAAGWKMLEDDKAAIDEMLNNMIALDDIKALTKNLTPQKKKEDPQKAIDDLNESLERAKQMGVSPKAAKAHPDFENFKKMLDDIKS